MQTARGLLGPFSRGSRRRTRTRDVRAKDEGGCPKMISGRQLRAARAFLGWPAERLGREADIHFRTVLKIERGEVRPRRSSASCPRCKGLGLSLARMARSGERNKKRSFGI